MSCKRPGSRLRGANRDAPLHIRSRGSKCNAQPAATEIAPRILQDSIRAQAQNRATSAGEVRRTPPTIPHPVSGDTNLQRQPSREKTIYRESRIEKAACRWIFLQRQPSRGKTVNSNSKTNSYSNRNNKNNNSHTNTINHISVWRSEAF